MKDFNIKIRRALQAKGVSIIGITALPGDRGSYANSQRGYRVNDNGTGRIWTYQEVITTAGA